MKVDFVCTSGSPIGVTPARIETGCGGAELALMTLAEVLAKRGHQVSIFNNPVQAGNYGGVQYSPLTLFNSAEARDAVVAFRTPYAGISSSKGKRVFWSCDQQTTGNYKFDIFPHVAQIVVISPYHFQYFINRYQADPSKMLCVGLGVRTWEYEVPVAKVPYQMIYCSVPARGLETLRSCWGDIVNRVPQATLKITFDFRLWGFSPGVEGPRLSWAGVPGVEYLGGIPRASLVRLQLESEVMPYPCSYDELFCISAAECQVAGCIPVTSSIGALATTNLYGKQSPGDPASESWRANFIHEVCETLTRREAMLERAELCRSTARTNFDWDKIAMVWEELVLK